MRPSRSSRTACQVVGLGRPLRLAEGATSGPPAAAIRSRASGAAGTRTATVSSPAVTAYGSTPRDGSTRLSGPGAHASSRARATSETSAIVAT